MKAKLIKSDVQYRLHNEEGIVIATSFENGKLSEQNCDEIFGVVDVDKLANEESYKAFRQTVWINGFKEGFIKAMEFNKDKLFTMEQMNRAIHLACSEYSGNIIDEVTQQPTEIEVEIEMKKVVDETKVIGAVKGVKGSGDKIITYKTIPKLDLEGCLILKKI
jgi:hypothetical protein